MTTACERIAPWLDGYHDGELEPLERNRVERHLESCAVCRRDLASLGAIGNAVRAAVAGTRSPDLWRDIEAQLLAERSLRRPRVAPRLRAPLRRRWLSVAAGAAAAASIFLVTFQMRPVPPFDAGPSGVVRSVYSPDHSVMVLEAEKSNDPTIIWLMDEEPETASHVRI